MRFIILVLLGSSRSSSRPSTMGRPRGSMNRSMRMPRGGGSRRR